MKKNTDYTLLVSTAAVRAGVDASYIRAQIREGKIDAEQKSPRLYLISESSFIAWMSTRKRRDNTEDKRKSA